MSFLNYLLLIGSLGSLPIVINVGIIFSSIYTKTDNNLFIYFFYFQGGSGPVDRMKIEIQQFFNSGGSSITDSSKKSVQLIQGQLLGETRHSVVWKGMNRNT